MKYPHIPFYTGDWTKDPALSKCSPAARGIWIDVLCAMWNLDRSGRLTGNVRQLSRICRCSDDEMASAINEFQLTESAGVTDDNGVITLVNRRMEREYKERQLNALRQKRFKAKQKSNGCETDFTDNDNDNDSTTSTSTGSKSKANPPTLDEVKTSASMIGLPESEAIKFWHHYQGNGWMTGQNPVADWGAKLSQWKAGWEERRFQKGQKPREAYI